MKNPKWLVVHPKQIISKTFLWTGERDIKPQHNFLIIQPFAQSSMNKQKKSPNKACKTVRS